ncbi:MAG: ferrous iron transport protein B [Verrucomicrobiota bacterium JB024]|nr:ferrous iron transport protein B [Verrucomicrobiota bacterium JB024]
MPSVATTPAVPKAPAAEKVFVVVGNPNSGKTTLFNGLTGLRQKVGNYPGVTVERKEGLCYSQHGKPIRLIDLPGAYTITAHSPDEAITQDILMGRRTDTPRPSGIICVADATNLERHLFLTTQLLELGLPVILVLNMIDDADTAGVTIDAKVLEDALGVTVVKTQARIGKGLTELRLAMSRENLPLPKWRFALPEDFQLALDETGARLRELSDMSVAQSRAEAWLMLTEATPDELHRNVMELPAAAREFAAEWTGKLSQTDPTWKEKLVGERYVQLSKIVRDAISRGPEKTPTLTDRIDSVLLHPVGGWFFLGLIMATIFYTIFTLSSIPMDWIDAGFGWLGEIVQTHMAPGTLRDLIVDGMIAGVGGVVIFLPQILILFFFVALLEGTGYMARAAFLLDRVMHKVGLHGQSFIPLLSAYACAIPGIMAARTIDSRKDRIVTILVTPWMSCSARLPVYFLMIAALAPGAPWIKTALMFFVYALGTFSAFAFAWIFKKTLMRGESPTLIMEMPPYRLPTTRSVVMDMLERAKLFLRKAGTIILGVSILLWFFVSYPKNSEGETDIAQSFAGQVGHALTPVTDPLGYDWKINIGLLASFAAREVFVSTMAIIYKVDDEEGEEDGPLAQVLQSEQRADGTAVFTPLTCLSLMVFYVFSLQCLSTVAVVKRETNSWRWPLFQLGYMTAVAYVAALLVYQGGHLLGFS